MRKTKLTMTLAVAALAANSVACSLQLEQILEVQEGSTLEIGVADLPPEVLEIEGGTVMGIDVTIGFFDLLFGSIEGDVEVPELLIAAPGFPFLGIPAFNTGTICVVPQAPGAGTFEADLHADTAAFDVTVDTIALLGNPTLANALPDGGFPFPFQLQSEVPFGLAEMLGLLTGSADLEVTQEIDLPFEVEVSLPPILPPTLIQGTVGGEITLASTDAFPTSVLLDECIARLEE